MVDAYNVMKRNGPRGVSVNYVVSMKAQIISTDFVAADTAAAKLFGAEPSDIRHIKIASDMGLGQMDLKNLLGVPLAEGVGSHTLYRMPWPVIAPVSVGVSLAMLVVWFCTRHGRLYCNTVCPVGTLLGLV